MRETRSGAGEVADDAHAIRTACASRSERDRALAVIGHIYDAALEPSRWNDVIRDVVEFVGGVKGLLASPAPAARGGFIFPYRLSESFLQRWQDEYDERDLWSRRTLERGLHVEGTAALGTELLPEEPLRASAAYQELAKHEGIGQLCVGIVFGARSGGGPPTLCAAFRSLADARFSNRERDRMRLLVPHLSRALGVMFRLRNAEFKAAASLAALDRLAAGVILLDALAQAIFTNRTAQRTVDQRDGLYLRSAQFSGGLRRIVATDAATQTRIDKAINDCLDAKALVVAHFSRGVTVRRPSGRCDLALQFAPLPRENEYDADGRHARVIAFVSDPDEGVSVGVATLTKLYGLTPAEGKLALQLRRGETLADAAKQNRITMTTARTQLASVFRKTGTARQAALVRLLVALGSTRGDSM